MARVSIYYDKDLKQQFFMIRGDERYARATKTILEIGTHTDNLYDFDLSVSVNVLRDEGDGTIVIYDNDAPLYVIDDWSSSDNARTITLEEMAYDIDHVLTAEYMGNNKCSSSISNSATINVHDTNRVTSDLTISSGTQFNPNAELTKTITLTNTAGTTSYNEGQEIDIYYDGDFVETVTTGDNPSGQASFTISDLGDAGLHTIRAEYTSSEHLTAKTVSQNISVGYNIEYVPLSQVLVKGVATDFKVTLHDYFGSPINNASIAMYDTYHSSPTPIDAVTTNSNGVATFTETINDVNSDNGVQHYQFLTTISSVSYSVNANITYVIPSSFDGSVPARLHKGESAVFSYNTHNAIEGIPVVLSGYVSETILTNNQGIASKTITGTGKTSKTITATFGSFSNSTTCDDFTQYWQPNDNHNRVYYANSNFMDLNNYYRITTSNIAVFQLPIANNVDYELIISGLTTSKSAYVGFVKNSSSWEDEVVIDVSNLNIQTGTTHSNETWKVIRDNNTVTVYKNNNVVNTFSNQGEYNPSFVYYNTTSTNFDFTKLTLREL